MWLDQSKQSDSPNGKITPAILSPLMHNRHLLVKFGNAKRLCLFCRMRQKHCWNYFVVNQSYLAIGKRAPVVILPHGAKQKCMILHGRIRNGSDWWFSKILGIRTGSDSILSDQDWTRTHKFHCPLISVKSTEAIRMMSQEKGLDQWMSNQFCKFDDMKDNGAHLFRRS